MNSMQNNGPDDKSPNDNLEHDLEKLTQSYQQLKHEDPPELLDQAVLNSAHRAVEGKARWMDFGWIHGLTTAAVVVLAFFIILAQRQAVRFEENGMLPAEPAAAREIQDDLRAKKAMRTEDTFLEDALLEESMMQVIAAERSQLPTEEAQLQAILILKHAGNDRWKAELKAFIESYPDYPLPDELRNL